MSFLYLSGLSSNLITSATLTSSSQDTNFPRTNLAKDYVWNMFRFNSAGTNDTLAADLGSTGNTVTFSSVHFHNLDSGVTSTVLESATSTGFGTPTTRATFTVGTPSFYSSFSAGTTHRYWRLKFNGTNSGGAIYLGKWVLGQSSSLTANHLKKWGIDYIRDRRESLPGMPLNLSSYPRRRLRLPFRHTTAAQKNEISTAFDNAQWGQEPIVAAPDSSESEVVYGRVGGNWSVERDANNIYDHTVDIDEDQFPVVVT